MNQLIVVEISNKNTMKLYKDDKLIKNINHVEIGKNGVNKHTYEGSMTTPLGQFNLGIAFGIHNLNINYPYIKINKNLYWVDDENSKYYNKLVSLNEKINNLNYPYIINLNKKDFSSAEHLIDYPKQYEYAIYIEYNVNGEKYEDGRGKSSAIFIHCLGDKGYTGGCIAIPREEMIFILNFLDINKNPKIIIKQK